MTLQRAQFVLLAGLISGLTGCVHTKSCHTGCGAHAHAQCCQCQCGCQAPQAQWTYQVPQAPPAQVPPGVPAELPPQPNQVPGTLPPKSAYEEDVPAPPPPTSALPAPALLR